MQYDAQNIWSLLETKTFTARAAELPLKVRHALLGKRAQSVRNPNLNIPLLLEVVNASSRQVLAQERIVPVASENGTTLSGETRLRPAIGTASDLKFRLRLERSAPRQVLQAAVINTYLLDTVVTLSKTGSQAIRGLMPPKEFALHPNFPNPFNPSTAINFDLPENGNVSLVVYDLLGRKVAELANGNRAAGYHSVTWNASDAASGVYFARFTATDGSGNIKLSKVSNLLLTKYSCQMDSTFMLKQSQVESIALHDIKARHQSGFGVSLCIRMMCVSVPLQVF